ncbi:MAG: hypothetical protein E7342_05380 [Clostridiales bacterium]|nr:hypothetical protein [Clostridiales bacterium]
MFVFILEDISLKKCVLYDRECVDCKECDKCDLDPLKICDSCGKCLETEENYKTIKIDEIIIKNFNS